MGNNKKKILIVFGTRPEAIKMAPIIRQFANYKDQFSTVICITAQHREMLDQVLKLFEIKPHYDLNLMKNNQTLSDLTSRLLVEMTKLLKKENPDLVIVQGDTTTTFISSLTAFYQKIKVAHIEAGLRTNNKFSPFPEEINRRLTSHIADIHFAPTATAKSNLISEGVDKKNIYVTGNTVIDALKWVVNKYNNQTYNDNMSKYFMDKYGINLNNSRKTILVTGHRRESFGEGFKNICNALLKIAKNNDVQMIYPVHLNPNVQKPIYSVLSDSDNIFLIEPLDYEPFVYLLNESYIILTDSGGIQEEAPFLGKPVLVMRNTTERPEGIIAGTAKLVSTDVKKIVKTTQNLLTDQQEYNKMAKAINPYGNGDSAKIILKIVNKIFCLV